MVKLIAYSHYYNHYKRIVGFLVYFLLFCFSAPHPTFGSEIPEKISSSEKIMSMLLTRQKSLPKNFSNHELNHSSGNIHNERLGKSFEETKLSSLSLEDSDEKSKNWQATDEHKNFQTWKLFEHYNGNNNDTGYSTISPSRYISLLKSLGEKGDLGNTKILKTIKDQIYSYSRNHSSIIFGGKKISEVKNRKRSKDNKFFIKDVTKNGDIKRFRKGRAGTSNIHLVDNLPQEDVGEEEADVQFPFNNNNNNNGQNTRNDDVQFDTQLDDPTISIGNVTTQQPEYYTQSPFADVISRGKIDSVMYVYFGDNIKHFHKQQITGNIIQTIGSVLAAVGQVIIILGGSRCIGKKRSKFSSIPVHLHIGFALLVSNMMLLLAVTATEPYEICFGVAICLHYFHLVVGSWLLTHTVKTYQTLKQQVETPTLFNPNSSSSTNHLLPNHNNEPSTQQIHASLPVGIATWLSPIPFILLSYLADSDGYETKRYCWMSIEKGMVVSFIVPIFLLIGFNTLLVILSLRHLLAIRKLWNDPSSSSDMNDDIIVLDEKFFNTGIRASAMLLPLLAIMWFLRVVALENSTSIFFQFAATSSNIALSWLVLYFLGQDIWGQMCCGSRGEDENNLSTSAALGLLYEDSDGCPSIQPTSTQISFDNEPLLSNSSSCILIQGGASGDPVPGTSQSFTSSGALNRKSYSNNNNNNLNNNDCSLSNNNISKLSIPERSIYPSSRGGKVNFYNSLKHFKKPNWLQPGGNEIYELKTDSISTIYK